MADFVEKVGVEGSQAGLGFVVRFGGGTFDRLCALFGVFGRLEVEFMVMQAQVSADPAAARLVWPAVSGFAPWRQAGTHPGRREVRATGDGLA
jgi:hypothetical protein